MLLIAIALGALLQTIVFRFPSIVSATPAQPAADGKA
jgi:hypothetical protein